MQSLKRRIEHLEHRTGAGTQPGLQLVVMRAGAEFALDLNKCAEILAECGFVRTGPGVSLLDFSDVPHGLNAAELERYLREHAEEICNPSAGQRPLASKADR
jgi:hypothetical protein